MKLKPGMREKENGSIEYRFIINGKRYSVCAKSVRDVLQKEQEKRQQIATQQGLRDGNVKFDDYCKVYIDRKKATARPQTYKQYESYIKRRISPYIGKMILADIQRKDLIAYRNQLIDDGSSAQAVNYTMQIVSNIFSEAFDDEVIKTNPAQAIKRIKTTTVPATKTVHRGLTVDEQNTFLEYAKKRWFYELYVFMLSTGVRIGEAAALQWSDVYNGEIHINKTLDYKTSHTPGPTKTPSSVRTIPMNDGIKSLLDLQEKKSSIGSDGYIFCCANGKPVYLNAVKKEINKIVKEINDAGIQFEPITSHCFRDTFATRAIEAGVNPGTVRDLLGHSTITTTMDIYAHILDEQKKADMDKIKIEI